MVAERCVSGHLSRPPDGRHDGTGQRSPGHENNDKIVQTEIMPLIDRKWEKAVSVKVNHFATRLQAMQDKQTIYPLLSLTH